MRRVILAFAFLTIHYHTASAATVAVNLRVDPGGTFEVYLQSSLDDNYGISSYLVNLENIATLIHTSPRLFTATNAAMEEGTAGFTQTRTGNNNPSILASQDRFSPTPHLIRGFGQVASSFVAEGLSNFGNPQTQLSWDVPLQIATGTWSGTAPIVTSAHINVFRESTGSTVNDADISFVGGPPAIVAFNGVHYPSGSTVDLGSVPYGGTLERTFRISNPGNSLLLLNSPSITSPFSINSSFPSSISTSPRTVNVRIGLNSSTPGSFSESFSFGTNLPGLETYNLQLLGEVLPRDLSGPAIDVFLGETAIPRGSNVSFGATTLGGVVQQTFTIKNPGLNDLILGSPSISGSFSLVNAFPTSIPFGGTADFTLEMDSSLVGSTTGSIAFATNAVGLPIFDLELTGSVQYPTEPPGGATVTVLLDISPDGTYSVSLSDPLGNNEGIVSYEVTLGNVATIVHKAPRSAAATDINDKEGSAGFTLSRSPTNANNFPSNPITITGSQDIIGPTPFLIRGFGQVPSSFAANGIITGGTTTQPAWGAPLQIITGTWTSNSLPTLNAASVHVWSSFADRAISSAQIQLVTKRPGPTIPEPSTITLAGLALVGLVGYARRRK